MTKNIDSKLLEISCKEILMNIVKESKILNKKLSFFQKTLLFDKISEMKYEDVISLLYNDGKEITIEEKKEFESDTKRNVKYAGAALAGRTLGHATIGKAGLKIPFGPEIIKGHHKSFKMTKGGIGGVLAGVGALYLFRKLSDPCIRQNLMDMKAQLSCRVDAIKKVINNLEYQLNNCVYAEEPDRCKLKVNVEINKWRNKLQELVIKRTSNEKK